MARLYFDLFRLFHHCYSLFQIYLIRVFARLFLEGGQ